jgi:pimeloyl-ACP methyl ester carboxylesterase
MTRLRVAVVGLLAVVGMVLGSSTAAYAAGAVHEEGSIGVAKFVIDIPAGWDGATLVLYSHGYVTPDKGLTAMDAGDPVTAGYLLAKGYALAGSSYSANGWALKEAFHDQIALLDYFDNKYGKPQRTIAWGHSLGGIITAGLIQRNPERFAGALPMCGVLAGGPGVWNQGLDAEFVFKTLASEPTASLQLTDITNPTGNFLLAESILAAEQGTPQGRARLALAAAVGDTPGWFTPLSPEPAASNFAARELNQFAWDANVDFPFLFALRAELEARAGGNPSWNTGVDYSRQLDRSINKDEVLALYAAAPGISLQADLEKLENTARVSAKPSALNYLENYIIFNGDIEQPVLTMHTTGDGLVLNQDEQAYASVVHSAGNSSLLRETFVHRAGHCTFTPAETVTAFKTLINRIKTGHWDDSTNPTRMNTAAAGLGPGLNVYLSLTAPPVPTAPAFLNFKPTVFLRPFDARNLDNGGEGDNLQS